MFQKKSLIPKIAIVGPESTGKSTLAEQLAQHYQTSWAQEFARVYLDQLGRSYTQSDLLEIAFGQVDFEKKALEQANQILICDTNLLVIKVWSEFKYGTCDGAILKEMKLEEYAHHFLCNIDFPWSYDPQREHPHRREELFNIYKSELENSDVSYSILSGTMSHRLESAVEKINRRIFAKE